MFPIDKRGITTKVWVAESVSSTEMTTLCHSTRGGNKHTKWKSYKISNFCQAVHFTYCRGQHSSQLCSVNPDGRLILLLNQYVATGTNFVLKLLVNSYSSLYAEISVSHFIRVLWIHVFIPSSAVGTFWPAKCWSTNRGWTECGCARAQNVRETVFR